MTAKESKAVAWQWHTGGPQFCTPEDKAKRLAAGDGFAKGYTIPLVPLSLLAEAESALKNAQENEDIEYALRAEAESRLVVLDRLHDEVTVQRDALQSRLDAVLRVADECAADGCNYYAGQLRSAVLGCATTGEGG